MSTRVSQYLTERKQLAPEWRTSSGYEYTPLERVARTILSADKEMISNAKGNDLPVTKEDYLLAFEKFVSPAPDDTLSILAKEVEHLLTLEKESDLREALMSLDRDAWWPEDVSAKEVFQQLSEGISKKLSGQPQQPGGNTA